MHSALRPLCFTLSLVLTSIGLAACGPGADEAPVADAQEMATRRTRVRSPRISSRTGRA